jgi:hypothetical protein
MYKVWVLNDNKVENIFVFKGIHNEFQFSEEDKLRIEKDNVSKSAIIESPVQIHKDDSILQIKKKILNEFGKDSLITYHELYLFAYKEKIIDLYKLFTETVSRSRNYLNREQFAQLLLILNKRIDISATDIKDKNTYDDFSKAMAKYDKTIEMPISLGMLPSNDNLFSPNPFDVVDYSPRNVSNSESSLLLNYGEIVDNNIYVCLADDVFACHEISEDAIAKTYYPFLTTKSIFDSQSLSDKRQQLIVDTNKIMERRHFDAYELVDKFYDIAIQANDVPINYVERGIRNYRIAIKPSYSFMMPLEMLFKNMHASEKYKLMKFNPGVRRENVYRIFSDKISKTGRKMPSLPRSVVNSLSKNIGKHKQISISSKDGVIIDIENDGTIILRGSIDKAIDAQMLTEILKDAANPLLEDINAYLKNNGYAIPLIRDLNADEIEILDMDYTVSIGNIKIEEDSKTKMKTTNVNLEKISGCLYSVFDIIDDNVFKGANLRFKRVENYKDMDQQTLLMTETYKKTGRDSDVIDALMKNHNMTQEEAIDRIRIYKKDVEYRSVNKFNDGNAEEKMIEVIENPGLPIEMNLNAVSKILTFHVNEISNIGYIESLSVYFESMMRIFQDKEMIKVCNKKEKENEIKGKKNKVFEEKPIEIKRADAFNFYSEISEEPSIKESLEEEESVKKKSPIEVMKHIIEEEEDSDEFDMVGLDIEGGGPKKKKEMESEEEEEESDEEEEGKEEGKEYVAKNKDKAKNINPFLQKLHENEPDIFLNGKDGKYNVYSRTCQSVHRQPVLITEEEKKNIDVKSPGSYKKAMKFGSTPGKQNYYICPQFWCFKTNTSMTEEQIKGEKKECGTDPEYWQEFNIPKEHMDAKGKYIHHYPGFKYKYKSKKMDYCMPCCGTLKWEMHNKDDKTKKWDKADYTLKKGEKINELGQLVLENGEIDPNWKEFPRNADKCNINESDKPENKSKALNVKFIYDPAKFREIPEEGRWGYVQYAVQHFMQIDYEDAKVKGDEAHLKNDAKTFLKYGVEQMKQKSDKKEDVPFNSVLGSLADVYADNIKQKPPRISDGKFGKILSDAVQINDFVKYGNASFTSIFRPDAIENSKKTEILDIDGESWIKTNGIWTNKKTNKAGFPAKVNIMKIDMDDAECAKYKKLDKEEEETILEKMAAYEMYKMYLENPAIEKELDHIWDLVSMPNANLFVDGMNMVIMEIKNNDITESIDLMCPTVTYSKAKFDTDKPTIFLIKHPDNLFEPVYMYNNGNKDIKRTFKDSEKIPQNIKSLLKKMNKVLNDNCRIRASMPEKYEYDQPISLFDLDAELYAHENYEILAQVVNYQGKTIALHVNNIETETNLYIPCKPSAPLYKYKTVIMDDQSVWSNYQETKDELTNLHKISPIIPCDVAFKIVEDSLLVGILTKSNQMVPINPPEENTQDDAIPTFGENNYFTYKKSKDAPIEYIDSETTRNVNGDAEREIIINNAIMENDFFTLFRSTIKTLLAESDNHECRDNLLRITRDGNKEGNKGIKMSYREKIIETVEWLRKLKKLDKMIEFGILKPEDIKIGKVILEPGHKLMIPIKNMVNEKRNNELLYYYRIADEILRYTKLKNFMLYPSQFLSSGNMEYKVNSDEFIALETSLQNEQEELKINQYMSGEIPADIAMPEKTQKYLNEVALVDQTQTNCILDQKPPLGNADIYWRKQVFPSDATEITFDSSIECSYEPLIRMYMKEKRANRPSIDEMREMIWDGYRDLVSNPKRLKKIISLMKERQGKSKLVENIHNANEFELMVKTDTYFLTTLDIYVVAQKQNLPIILFSNGNTLNDIGFDQNWLILGLSNKTKSSGNKFHFIRSQKRETNEKPKHRIIAGRFETSDLHDMKKRIENAIKKQNDSDNIMTVENFLDI